ncbi:hypothetical protein TP41_17695 [Xanthomonas euvesicatoria pv. citrumelonis]|nr:hypothetical protein TP41_17695 [Xanthomonas euvesicatoria pv. citrumelonis]
MLGSASRNACSNGAGSDVFVVLSCLLVALAWPTDQPAREATHLDRPHALARLGGGVAVGPA